MKTILLNVYEEKVQIIDIEPTLDEYYKTLDCSCIDIVERKIGGKFYDVMCDDEGLFREPQKISAINDMGEPMFVGNLLLKTLSTSKSTLRKCTRTNIRTVTRC